MIPIQQTIHHVSSDYLQILNDNLVGIYLHGSYAMNCFNPNRSDLDLIVVVNEPPDLVTMRQLVSVLLELSADEPAKGFEMSILLASDCMHIQYPTPFVLHFSNFHKDRYLSHPDYICGGSTDPDLAAHIMVLVKRGICQCGKPIREVFQPVSEKHYVASIIRDISSAADAIFDDPIYYVLNLCRVLYYLKEGMVSSKKEAAEWAIPAVSPGFSDIVSSALRVYESIGGEMGIGAERLSGFVDYMNHEIQAFNLDLPSAAFPWSGSPPLPRFPPEQG